MISVITFLQFVESPFICPRSACTDQFSREARRFRCHAMEVRPKNHGAVLLETKKNQTLQQRKPFWMGKSQKRWKKNKLESPKMWFSCDLRWCHFWWLWGGGPLAHALPTDRPPNSTWSPASGPSHWCMGAGTGTTTPPVPVDSWWWNWKRWNESNYWC